MLTKACYCYYYYADDAAAKKRYEKEVAAKVGKGLKTKENMAKAEQVFKAMEENFCVKKGGNGQPPK